MLSAFGAMGGGGGGGGVVTTTRGKLAELSILPACIYLCASSTRLLVINSQCEL
jgi:hypothetical protein